MARSGPSTYGSCCGTRARNWPQRQLRPLRASLCPRWSTEIDGIRPALVRTHSDPVDRVLRARGLRHGRRHAERRACARDGVLRSMAFVPLWFVLIAILWTGFFVLEGFDMGVGMLNGIVGKDDAGTRTVINTIGPLWDGNEVWLIVAGAAIFAAFPGWYATMFSGLYLAVVLLLVALILRGVSFEFRGKRDSAAWRRMWDGLLTGGSLLVPLLIGIALGDLLNGLPIDKSGNYTGTFWDLLTPYGIYTGITLVAICVLHGATFIMLKTTGDVTDRAARVAARSGPAVALIVIGWVVWTHVTAGKGFWPNPVEIGTFIVIIA